MRAYKRLKLWILLRQLEREQTILESHINSKDSPHDPHKADRELRAIILHKHQCMSEIIALGGKPPTTKLRVVFSKIKKAKLK